jgi:uncharacterized protein (DUF1800 family)
MGTKEEKLALINSFDQKNASRSSTLAAEVRGAAGVASEAMAARQPQQLVNGELIENKLYRAIYSNRQLGRPVDFWMNHFNVFNGKGQDRGLLTSYERDAIRPYIFDISKTCCSQPPAILQCST